MKLHQGGCEGGETFFLLTEIWGDAADLVFASGSS